MKATKKEKEIMNHLVQAHKKFVELPREHLNEINDWVFHLHAIQRILHSRVIMRSDLSYAVDSLEETVDSLKEMVSGSAEREYMWIQFPDRGSDKGFKLLVFLPYGLNEIVGYTSKPDQVTYFQKWIQTIQRGDPFFDDYPDVDFVLKNDSTEKGIIKKIHPVEIGEITLDSVEKDLGPVGVKFNFQSVFSL